MSSLLKSVKSLSEEVAALKRAAARSEADEPARAAASRQRTIFAPSLATASAAASSSPTLAPLDDDASADRSRALPRGVSSRRKFDVQVRHGCNGRAVLARLFLPQLTHVTLCAPCLLLQSAPGGASSGSPKFGSAAGVISTQSPLAVMQRTRSTRRTGSDLDRDPVALGASAGSDGMVTVQSPLQRARPGFGGSRRSVSDVDRDTDLSPGSASLAANAGTAPLMMSNPLARL